MTAERRSSSGAWREIARLGRRSIRMRSAFWPAIPAGHLLDAGKDADGGDGDAVGRDEFGEDLDRPPHALDVEQRLAHAHEDDVQPLGRQAAVGADGQHLGHDLARREVAARAPVAGDAEGAGERAAGLAGDAEGVAPLVGDVHGFDGGAVVQAEEIFARAVRRLVARGHRRQADAEALGETAPQLLREVGQVRKVARPTLVESLVDLLHPERLVHHGAQNPGELLARQPEKVHAVGEAGRFAGRSHGRRGPGEAG